MKRVYYRSDNPAFRHETNDCAVIALTNATGCYYHEAHALLKANGRRDGEATYMFGELLDRSLLPNNKRAKRLDKSRHQFMESDPGAIRRRAWKSGHDVDVDRFDPYFSKPFRKDMTLSRFAKENPKGTFILGVHNHACVIKDGVLYDNRPQSRARIHRAHEILDAD